MPRGVNNPQNSLLRKRAKRIDPPLSYLIISYRKISSHLMRTNKGG
jgi:hypothetical protein